jgi:flagellar transcriptional activator FlhC
MQLAKLESMQLAVELIQAKLRLSVVQSLTNLTKESLRVIWKETHGERPPTGLLPSSALSFVTNLQTVRSLSAIVLLHQRLHKTKELTARSLLETWKAYQTLLAEINPSDTIDINAAYFVLRDVRIDILTVMQCGNCKVSYIHDRAKTLTSRCPYCKGE